MILMFDGGISEVKYNVNHNMVSLVILWSCRKLKYAMNMKYQSKYDQNSCGIERFPAIQGQLSKKRSKGQNLSLFRGSEQKNRN